MARMDKPTGAVVPLSGFGMGRDLKLEDSMERRGRRTRCRPKVVSLTEPGQWIDGLLIGKGSGVEIEDAASGDARHLSTWIFDCGGGLLFGLMGSHQLDGELPELVAEPPKRVRVTLLGQVQTRKGMRVKDYQIEEYVDAEVVEEREAAF